MRRSHWRLKRKYALAPAPVGEMSSVVTGGGETGRRKVSLQWNAAGEERRGSVAAQPSRGGGHAGWGQRRPTMVCSRRGCWGVWCRWCGGRGVAAWGDGVMQSQQEWNAEVTRCELSRSSVTRREANTRRRNARVYKRLLTARPVAASSSYACLCGANAR